jgi:hypothetical protein
MLVKRPASRNVTNDKHALTVSILDEFVEE